jgi:CRP-like cAMP-binding protein
MPSYKETTMIKKKLNYLAGIDIFRDLNVSERLEIEPYVTTIKSTLGKMFYMPEDHGEVLYFLIEGKVQLYRISLTGKKLVTAIVGPGHFFGEMSVVGNGLHSTFAESVENCLISMIGRQDFIRLLRTEPQVALRFVEAIGSRMNLLEANLEDIAFKDVPSRLAGLLLRSAEEQGRIVEVKGFSHQDLGEMLGSYRETVTQVLNDFKANGLIDIGRKHITLLDRGSLEAVAQS